VPRKETRRARPDQRRPSVSSPPLNTDLQKDPRVRAPKEADAYPAMAERGYGWEKLMSEMFCQEYGRCDPLVPKEKGSWSGHSQASLRFPAKGVSIEPKIAVNACRNAPMAKTAASVSDCASTKGTLRGTMGSRGVERSLDAFDNGPGRSRKALDRPSSKNVPRAGQGVA